MTLVRCVIALLLGCAVGMPLGVAGAAEPPVRVPLREFPPTPRAVYGPADVVRDQAGAVWIADTGNNRVRQLGADGELLGTWTSDGVGVEFNRPTAIAVASSGRVYVADTNNHRVVVIGATGQVEGSFGGFGTGDGQFNRPMGIAVDASGKVYVADTSNHRIQRFSEAGAFESVYGSPGSQPGQFSSPKGLSVLGTQVFVADSGNKRVASFSTDFVWSSSWGPFAQGEFTVSRYNSPSDVWAVGSTVYVADTGNYQIEACTTVGEQLFRWGSVGGGDGEFQRPGGVWADGASMWIADTDNNRLQQLTTAGVHVQTWKAPGADTAQLNEPRGVALDNAGNTYVADSLNGRVQKYSATGVHLLSIGAGVLSGPAGVAVDASGFVYVADTGNNLVRKFTSAGVESATFGSGVLSGPQGVAVDSAGRVYVADTGSHMVRVYEASGTLALQWGGGGSGVGQLSSPKALAVSGSTVYVSDTGNSRISRFQVDSGATALGTWGTLGTQPGMFIEPAGVAIATDGGVWVCDSGNNRLQEFSATGELITTYGHAGGGLGEFHEPRGLAAGPNGLLVTSEGIASRVQVVGLDSTPPITTVSGIPVGWSQDVTATLDAVDDIGIAFTRYRQGSGPVSTYSVPVTGFPEGESLLYYSSVDTVGRVETTKSATVFVDRTPPVTSSNVDSSWHKSPFSVVLTRSDALSGVASTQYWLDGAGPFAYTGSFAVSGEGARELRFKSTDIAGNVATESTATLRIDDTPPTTVSDATGQWSSTPQTLTLTPRDDLSGVAAVNYRIGSSLSKLYTAPFLVSAEGVTRVTFAGIDVAGNRENTQTATVRLDRTPPVTLISVGDPQPDDTRMVTLSGADAGVGLSAIYYSVNGINPNSYGSPFPIDAWESATIEFWSIDRLDNREDTQTAVLQYDFQPPVTTSTVDGAWRTTPEQVSLGATDALSGVRDSFYRIGEGPTTAYSGVPFTVDAEGETRVTFWSVDNAGIREADNFGWVRIDRLAPESTTTVVFDPYGSSAVVAVEADDDGGIGLAGIEYRIGSSPTWLPYADPITLDTPGDNVFWYRSVDSLGNVEDAKSTTITLRELVPTTTSTVDELWHNGDVTVGLSSSYDGPSQVSTFYRIGAEGSVVAYAAPFTITAEGETEIEFWSSANGVTEATRRATVRIDRAAPQTTYSQVVQTGPNRVTVTLAATDGSGSGLEGTYYRVGNGAVWTRYSGPFGVDGGSIVWYRSVDNAGNDELAQFHTLPPTTVANVSSARWYRTNVLVSLVATQPAGAPTITYYRFAGQTLGTRYTGPFIVSREGVTAIQYWSVADGVSEIRKRVDVHIDKTAPLVTYLVSPTHRSSTTAYSSHNVLFRWSATDRGSGVYGYSYVLDRRAVTYPSTARVTTRTSAYYRNRASGTWYLHVRSRDKAGNWGPPRHLRVRIR